MNKPKSKNKILKDKLGLIGLSEGNHINFLTNNKKYIQWTVLSGNKNAMDLINEELKKVKMFLLFFYWSHYYMISI